MRNGILILVVKALPRGLHSLFLEVVTSPFRAYCVPGTVPGAVYTVTPMPVHSRPAGWMLPMLPVSKGKLRDTCRDSLFPGKV